jgi:hypothetical protein
MWLTLTLFYLLVHQTEGGKRKEKEEIKQEGIFIVSFRINSRKLHKKF